MNKHLFTFLFFVLMSVVPLSAQTIAEKKEELSKKEAAQGEALLCHVNRGLRVLREELVKLYETSSKLKKEGASEVSYQKLLKEIQVKREEMRHLEEKWMSTVVDEAKNGEEGYALWDQEETTLSQLIMEYGAMDYVYVVPPEMAALKLNIHSNIPVPRESWSDVMEIILSHNGIGVKELNAYARQLYILKQNPSAITHVVAHEDDLLAIPSQARLFYVLSPPVEQVKTVFQFFERFSDAKQTFVYQLGAKLALVASKEEIEKLLSIYNSVWTGSAGKVARVIPVTKMNVKEMEKILSAFFSEALEKGRSPFVKGGQNGLSLFSLTQGSGLVLIGEKEVVDRAEGIVRETEDQLQDPSEKTVYLYTCRHSDPVELAGTLEKVYESLLTVASEKKESVDISYTQKGGMPSPPDGYQTTPPLVVSPPPFNPATHTQIEVEKNDLEHFIADPKSGTILMVVRRDVLDKIKELLRKLDIPKRMVQIEVLLFEKQLNSQSSMGMNLLKLGTNRNGIDFQGGEAPSGLGVFQYLLHHHRTPHFPKVDLAFNFLMTQEDIQLNASPSILTVNQTPATISIQDEISIKNGAAPIDSNKGIVFKDSFTRAQYGITIVMTPTVHLSDSIEEFEEGKGSITMQTNISFDTPKTSSDHMPEVNRRHIENEVRVADGETVIIGGLRKKNTEDSEDRIPIISDIPFFGKFFGSSKLVDKNTEMFFFITPKIILDPKEQLERERRELMCKRPGDLPEYLQRLVCAREREKNRFFRKSYQMIFGL